MSYSSSYLTHFKKTLKYVHLDFCIANSSWNLWAIQKISKMGQGSVPLNCSTKAKMIITTKPFHPTVLYNARVIQASQWMTMVRILLDAARRHLADFRRKHWDKFGAWRLKVNFPKSRGTDCITASKYNMIGNLGGGAQPCLLNLLFSPLLPSGTWTSRMAQSCRPFPETTGWREGYE